MRFSSGGPGKTRTDKGLSKEVKAEHGLGEDSGDWKKNRFPKNALLPIEQIATAARAYHDAVTLPFDKGIGILPAALVMEYAERMKGFAAKFYAAVNSHFRANYPDFVAWARAKHNGTFNADDYPDVEELVKEFYFKTVPLPVPDASHYQTTIASLLGTDTESVNVRVQDAMQEGMRELMKRMIEPIKAMAEKLVEEPKMRKNGKMAEDICFRDTLIGNIKEIAELAPKLNLSGDPVIDQFAAQMTKLANVSPEKLRDDKSERAMKAAAAADLLKRLEGYKI